VEVPVKQVCVMSWVGMQYVKVMHECVGIFPKLKINYTWMQCLTSNPCDVRFINLQSMKSELTAKQRNWQEANHVYRQE